MGIQRLSQLNLGFLAVAVWLVLLQPGCGKSPTTPDPPPPPPPPTQYVHTFKVEAKTLHFGEAVTGTFTVKMLTNSKEFTANVGETVTIDTTTKQQEACDIVINCTGCLPREFRNVSVTKNVLTTDVIKLEDVEWDFLFRDVLTTKDSEGHSVNQGWIPRIINVSSNPDPQTGFRLYPSFFDGRYIDPYGLVGIYYAMYSFQTWGKRYVGTPFEEPYIQTISFDLYGNHPYDPTVPPDGDFWVIRTSGVFWGQVNITYPVGGPGANSSKMIICQEHSEPAAACFEAWDALMGDGQDIGDIKKYATCIPILMWRPRDRWAYGTAANNWITATKESQEGIDTFSTFQTLSMSPAETNNLKPSPVGTLLGPGTTSTNRPTRSQGSSNSPAQTGSSRPSTKERIRN